MADYNLVTDRLAVGAALTSQADVAQLLEAGITAVIDARVEFDDTALFAGSGIGVLWAPTADDGQHKDPAWFAVGIEFALPLLARPGQRCLCHCAAGVNRGPSMCYALLRAWGLRPDQAEGLIRSVRPQVGLAYKTDADAAVIQLGYA